MLSLNITSNTSITDLQVFLRDNSNAALHGKLDEDGNCVLYVRKGKGNRVNYLFKTSSKEDRQAYARIAILKVLKNYDENPEMQNVFNEHFKEIEDQFHEDLARENPKAALMQKECPADRVKELADYLAAPLPRHMKKAVVPPPAPAPVLVLAGSWEKNNKPPKKSLDTLRATTVMRMLAPEAAPLNHPERKLKSTDPIQDLNLLELRFDEDKKLKTFFRDVAIYFNQNLGIKNPALTEIDKQHDFIKALSPTLKGTGIFPSLKKDDGPEFALAVQTFIQDAGLYCPYKLDKAAEQILAVGVTILRKLPIAVEVFIQKAQTDPAHIKHCVDTEFNGMITDIRGAWLGAEMFTNEEFLKNIPESKQTVVF